MPIKNIVVALLVVSFAITGLVSGVFLVRDRQRIEKKAATPTGETTVSVSPESDQFDVGDTIVASIFFNTANIPISGVAVRLTYPFSGATPEVAVEEITVNPSLLTPTGDWQCPTQTSEQQGDNVVIDIACANRNAFGFTSSEDTLLASVSLSVDRVPATNPLIVRFDPADSLITRKSDNQDILLIPTSTGIYTIAGAGDTSTPTLTQPAITTTLTTTLTPTSIVSTTPTSTPSATPTPYDIPATGISYPTMMGVGVGILAIILALVLVL
jgi:hypothetical protein